MQLQKFDNAAFTWFVNLIYAGVWYFYLYVSHAILRGSQCTLLSLIPHFLHLSLFNFYKCFLKDYRFNNVTDTDVNHNSYIYLHYLFTLFKNQNSQFFYCKLTKICGIIFMSVKWCQMYKVSSPRPCLDPFLMLVSFWCQYT